MLNMDVVRKMDEEAQKKFLTAQIDELVERRQVRDGALYKHSFEMMAPPDAPVADVIEDFDRVAGEAFDLYHDLRKKNAKIDPDTGALVIPDPAPR